MAEKLGITAFLTEVSQHRVWGSLATLAIAFELPCLQAWAQPLDCQSTLGSPSCQPRLLSASGSLDVFEMNAPSPAEEMVSSISMKRQITKHSNCHFCETTQHKALSFYWLAAAAGQHHSAPTAWAQQHCVPGACSAVTKREKHLV